MEEIAQDLAAAHRRLVRTEHAADRQGADQSALELKTVSATPAEAAAVSASDDKTRHEPGDQIRCRLDLGVAMLRSHLGDRAAFIAGAPSDLMKKSLIVGKIAEGKRLDARDGEHRGLAQGGEKDREKLLESSRWLRDGTDYFPPFR